MNFQQKLALLNSSRGEKKLLSDRGRNWGYEETMDLLTLWSDESVQNELEASVRNQHVYEKISAAMQEKGYPRTAEQCRDKVKKLKKDYNDVMSNKTIMSRGMCKYFEIIDKILRNRSLSLEPEVLLDTPIKCDPDGPQTQIPVIIDSYSEQKRSRDPDVNSQLSDYSQSPSEISENASPDGELRKDINSIEDPLLLNKSLTSNSLPHSSNSKIPPSRRRRKTNKAELMLAGIVDRFVETLQNAEARYIALEEKRLRLTMELEEKRQEREENRRREERQHEMQLVQMITQAISTVAASPTAAPQNTPNSSTSSTISIVENTSQALKSNGSKTSDIQIMSDSENDDT